MNNINPKSDFKSKYPFHILIDNDKIEIFGNLYYHSIFLYWISIIEEKGKNYMVYKIEKKQNTIVLFIMICIIYFMRLFKPIDKNIIDNEFLTKEIEFNFKTKDDNEDDTEETKDDNKENNDDNKENNDDDIDLYILKKVQKNIEYLDGFYILSYNNCLLPKYSENLKEMIDLNDFYFLIDRFNLDYLLEELFIGIFYIGENDNNIDYSIFNKSYRILIIVWEKDEICYFKLFYKKKDELFIYNLSMN